MSLPSTIYRGHELYVPRINRREQPDIDAVVAQQTIDSKTGPLAVLRPTASHVHTKPQLYFFATRAEVTAFTLYLARRRGMYAPVWVGSGHSDLELAAGIGASDTTITLAASGYTDFAFPLESRRHLAFVSQDVSVVARRVDAAEDNGDGTETLTLESALGVAFPVYGTLVSFLTLARLDADAVTIHWHHPNLAEARVRYVELPREMEWPGEFPEDPA